MSPPATAPTGPATTRPVPAPAAAPIISAWAVGEIARIAVIAFGWKPHDFVLKKV